MNNWGFSENLEVLPLEKRDRQKAEKLLDAFISWTNADHEDSLTIGRNHCCYMRDEIERLRKIEKAAHDALIRLLPHAVAARYVDHPDVQFAADIVAKIEGAL
jgi:hypothetical protein